MAQWFPFPRKASNSRALHLKHPYLMKARLVWITTTTTTTMTLTTTMMTTTTMMASLTTTTTMLMTSTTLMMMATTMTMMTSMTTTTMVTRTTTWRRRWWWWNRFVWHAAYQSHVTKFPFCYAFNDQYTMALHASNHALMFHTWLRLERKKNQTKTMHWNFIPMPSRTWLSYEETKPSSVCCLLYTISGSPIRSFSE